MTRIDVKMMDSKELRELRTMIRKELDFRAEIGQELEDGRIKEWISATEWSARIQKEKEEKEEEKKTQIVKEVKEKGDGELYLEFTKDELDMLGLEKGDSVEWMELDEGEVWKKVTKKKWSI